MLTGPACGVRRVDHTRLEGHNDEAFVLELQRPLGGRHEAGSLRDAVRDHVLVARHEHGLEVRAPSAQHDDLLEGGGRRAEERQEGGDAVDYAEGVDFELCTADVVSWGATKEVRGSN